MRNHVIIVEPLAEFGVRGDFGVPDPEKSAQYMREEDERWGNVIKAADIKLQ